MDVTQAFRKWHPSIVQVDRSSLYWQSIILQLWCHRLRAHDRRGIEALSLATPEMLLSELGSRILGNLLIPFPKRQGILWRSGGCREIQGLIEYFRKLDFLFSSHLANSYSQDLILSSLIDFQNPLTQHFARNSNFWKCSLQFGKSLAHQLQCKCWKGSKC